MVFTESDAENDGLIKREVGREMAKVAQSQNPQLYEYFVNVCEEIGRSPQDILGEMAVRALNSEEFAQRVFESEVSMRELQADQIRIEDVEYVQKLTEKLDLGVEEQTQDPIDELIQQRLQSVTSTPFGQFKQSRQQGGSGFNQAMQHMEKMEQRMARMEQRMAGDGQGQEVEQTQTTTQNSQSVDELFDDGGQDNSQEENQTNGEQTVDETFDQPDDTSDISDTETEDVEPPQEEIQGGADELVEDNQQDSEGDSEEIPVNVDIPSETKDEEPEMFSSDGVDEE